MNDKPLRSPAAKSLFDTYVNDKPGEFKQARITQLAEMHASDSSKMADELEAMAEILYALEKDAYDPRDKVMAACMADLATVLAIQYMTKPGEQP